MREIYQYEKDSLLQAYMNILDQTAKNVKYVDGKFINTLKPLEISKKFGFDYYCNLHEKGQTHKYSGKAKDSFDKFKEKAKAFFPTF